MAIGRINAPHEAAAVPQAQRMARGGCGVHSGAAPGKKFASRRLARRLLHLKPKTLHPVLHDGNTDRGVAIVAAQVR